MMPHYFGEISVSVVIALTRQSFLNAGIKGLLNADLRGK
jgi:hypothetical protein